jgi:hypothetical protein
LTFGGISDCRGYYAKSVTKPFSFDAILISHESFRGGLGYAVKTVTEFEIADYGAQAGDRSVPQDSELEYLVGQLDLFYKNKNKIHGAMALRTKILCMRGRSLACNRFSEQSNDEESDRNRNAATSRVANSVLSDSKWQPTPGRGTAQTESTDPAVSALASLLASKLSLPSFPDGQLACMQSSSRVLAGVMSVSKLKMLVKGIDRSCGTRRS